MPDFDNLSPPLRITNPIAVKQPPNTEYPRHLHKAGGEYVIVANDTERDEHLALGYALLPPAAPGKGKK